MFDFVVKTVLLNDSGQVRDISSNTKAKAMVTITLDPIVTLTLLVLLLAVFGARIWLPVTSQSEKSGAAKKRRKKKSNGGQAPSFPISTEVSNANLSGHVEIDVESRVAKSMKPASLSEGGKNAEGSSQEPPKQSPSPWAAVVSQSLKISTTSEMPNATAALFEEKMDAVPVSNVATLPASGWTTVKGRKDSAPPRTVSGATTSDQLSKKQKENMRKTQRLKEAKKAMDMEQKQRLIMHRLRQAA